MANRRDSGIFLAGMITGGTAFGIGAIIGIQINRANESDPVVVTDADNRVIDMPAGVRWDIQLESNSPQMVAWCDQQGGVMVGFVCEDVDF